MTVEASLIPQFRGEGPSGAWALSSPCPRVAAQSAEGGLCVFVVRLSSIGTSQPPRHEEIRRPGRNMPAAMAWEHTPARN